MKLIRINYVCINYVCILVYKLFVSLPMCNNKIEM